MGVPTLSEAVPALTTEQMVEVDRAMVEDYGIELLQMMENAGRNLAHLARARFLHGGTEGRRVTVLAGTGGNGGGAMVCVRRLHNWGADVSVLTTAPDDQYQGVPKQQLEILRRMEVPIAEAEEVHDAPAPELVVDGVIGYGLTGPPQGTAAELIRWADQAESPILALDAPSGLDTTTGQVFDPAVRATATLTLALPKHGLLLDAVSEHVGELYLADISVPPALYQRSPLGLNVGCPFGEGDVVRIK